MFKASVKENKEIAENHYLLTLHPFTNIKAPRPGQFFMLSVDTSSDPLLKRPFSLHRLTNGDIQILYRVLGKATNILKGRMPGDQIEMLGPLGNGFPINNINDRKIIFAAGGIGIAPIMALADSVTDSNPRLFYGARTGKELLCLDEFKSLGIDYTISTDDGSAGEKGNVVDALSNFFSSEGSEGYIIYACGPKPMLKALSELSKKHSINAYMALEENMACGIGTCLGCVVNTNSGFRRVCKEGPVFSSEEIVW